tara:strand:- start:225 stop:1397 length:1173 start_codon:yes stop_codon:yes gene_type:complete
MIKLKSKKTVCVITGSRADYGILKLLIERLNNSKKSYLKLIATGMHLSKNFGNTYKEILDDGFAISEKINTLINGDEQIDTAISVSTGVKKFSKSLTKIKPDVVILLGDRTEIFAAATACMILNLPIAHIHGGETTEGVIDEPMRHAITKMSFLHFTTHQKYKKRVIQLGENPNTVFNVGAPSLERIKKVNIAKKSIFEKELKIEFNKKNVVVTFHPLTGVGMKFNKKRLSNLLQVLSNLKDTNIFITKTNSDPMGLVFNNMIDKFSANKKNIFVFKSLGYQNYISLIHHSDGVIGNSSSGIIEVPSLKKGTVNIGDRQKGRILPTSVIQCGYDKNDIIKAINILFSSKFSKKILKSVNPYYKSKSSKRIIDIIESTNFKSRTDKKFFDL